MVVKDKIVLLQRNDKIQFERELEEAIRNGWEIYPETFKILVSKSGNIKGYIVMLYKKYRTSSTGLKKMFGRLE